MRPITNALVQFVSLNGFLKVIERLVSNRQSAIQYLQLSVLHHLTPCETNSTRCKLRKSGLDHHVDRKPVYPTKGVFGC